MQPGEPALAAQPGLIEVHDRGGGQPGGDLVKEWAEVTGGSGGHSRDGPVGDRDGEQFADGLRGALFGQELAHDR